VVHFYSAPPVLFYSAVDTAERHPAGDYPHSDFPDPVSHLVDEERRAAFEQSGVLFESSYVLTFVYLPPIENVGRAEQLLIESAGDKQGLDYHDHLDSFIQQTDRALDPVLGPRYLIAVGDTADIGAGDD